MSKRPVMACAECGPVITERVLECPLCPGVPGHDVYWTDVVTGLYEMTSDLSDSIFVRLLNDTRDLIRVQQDTIESLQQAQGGDQEARIRLMRELKAKRLAEVLSERAQELGAKLTPDMVLNFTDDGLWAEATRVVNDRYRSRHHPPSHETKALVAAKFAQPERTP